MQTAGPWSGKVVLVTGASSGIGASCAKLIGKLGASLALSALPRDGFEDIRRLVSPDKVAPGLIRGVERRKRTVFVPKIGFIFTSLDFFAPRVMDWYIRGKM